MHSTEISWEASSSQTKCLFRWLEETVFISSAESSASLDFLWKRSCPSEAECLFFWDSPRNLCALPTTDLCLPAFSSEHCAHSLWNEPFSYRVRHLDHAVRQISLVNWEVSELVRGLLQYGRCGCCYEKLVAEVGDSSAPQRNGVAANQRLMKNVIDWEDLSVCSSEP
jgi:hypothetical protein